VAGSLILVVDDTPANLKLAAFLLTRAGFEVRTAQHATEARAAVRDAPPALILMDLQLPGVDGFALTTEFKRDPALASVPIVAMTAYAMTGDDQRAREAGCDWYLTKPIDPLTFAERIRSYLRAPGPR
jgi:two-component system cell cycle response regulator DivK